LTYVSLMPDEGFSALVRLRDALHTGPLARHLRLDIPFTPHVTVARLATPRPAKVLADSINALSINVAAPVASLDVVRYEGTDLVAIARVSLGG
jgi:2'-5' RNA ligase